MQVHATKIRKNRVIAVANQPSKAFQLEDNRPEAKQLARLQGMADNSPQAANAARLQAMADNSPHAVAQKMRMEGLSGEPVQSQGLQGVEHRHNTPQTIQLGKGKKGGRDKGSPLIPNLPKIGNALSTLTPNTGPVTKIGIFVYNGKERKPADGPNKWATIHRHTQAGNPTPNRFDTLAHLDWNDGVRPEYDEVADAIVGHRKWY